MTVTCTALLTLAPNQNPMCPKTSVYAQQDVLCPILPVDQTVDLFWPLPLIFGTKNCNRIPQWGMTPGVSKVDSLKCFTSPGLMTFLPVSVFDALLQSPHPPSPLCTPSSSRSINTLSSAPLGSEKRRPPASLRPAPPWFMGAPGSDDHLALGPWQHKWWRVSGAADGGRRAGKGGVGG